MTHDILGEVISVTGVTSELHPTYRWIETYFLMKIDIVEIS